MESHFKRILVFQTAFLGDALLAIPLLKKLKALYPQARLGFVCRQGVGEFFRAVNLVHTVIEVDKKNSASLTHAFRESEAFEPDLILSLHESFRTALWVWRLRAASSVGFRSWWNKFAFAVRIKRDLAQHDVLRQLSLLRGLGQKEASIDSSVTLEVKLEGRSRFQFEKPFVILAPGSQWNTKRWIPEKFAELGQRLEKSGLGVVLVGTPNETGLCEQVAVLLKAPRNLCGQTSIVELAQVIRGALCVYANDSGTTHISTAVGTPVVSIFGPTVPAQGYGPWSKNSKIVEITLACRPCGAHGHDACPIGTHDCMKLISVDQVLQAGSELALQVKP